jgi:hypothetical protein
MMDRIIDNATFGNCHECGDEISLQNVTEDEILAKGRKVDENGGRCDRCEEGITAFDKRVRFHILQWIGPIAFRQHLLSVTEPQNASYAVVTLRDGRKAKIFARGESRRELSDEVDAVFRKEFPDLKKAVKP